MWQAVINIFQVFDIGPTFYGSWFSSCLFWFLPRFIKAYKKFGLPLER